MANDERLERIIRIDEAVQIFQSRYLPHDQKDWVRERFDRYDRRQQDRSQRRRIERR
jgi:hypothetical protein